MLHCWFCQCAAICSPNYIDLFCICLFILFSHLFLYRLLSLPHSPTSRCRGAFIVFHPISLKYVLLQIYDCTHTFWLTWRKKNSKQRQNSQLAEVERAREKKNTQARNNLEQHKKIFKRCSFEYLFEFGTQKKCIFDIYMQ